MNIKKKGDLHKLLFIYLYTTQNEKEKGKTLNKMAFQIKNVQ